MRTTYCSLACLALCIVAQVAAGQAEAQAQPEGNDKPKLPPYVEALQVTAEGSQDPLAPTDRALFSYSDAARVIADGAIWAWGKEGRPLAMAKCWKNRNGSQTCAFSLTSDTLVTARGPEGKLWQPQETQTMAAELKGAPTASSKASLRLLQIKEQARRFTAHEFWNPENDRFELRLLTQPVHRYRDDKLGIIDGAVFLLAYDNNPQVLLLIEIVRPDEGPERWQYLLARVSSADLHVLLDGEEVWTRARTPGIVGQPSDYYWHMVTFPTAEP